MEHRNFLLYLKALIWSVFVSYSNSTVAAIAECLREGVVSDAYPEFRDTHLGESLRFLIGSIPSEDDRRQLAACMEQVKSGAASMVYRNMVIEVGHYVTAKQPIGDIPADCNGVVYCLGENIISVVFRKADKSLIIKEVQPYQVLPVYTLTIPES